MVILLSRNDLLITRISLIAILVIRIELLVRRSNRKDFFSKECITFESLEKKVSIKGGGRPTRLLPHAKMLYIPIKLFLSPGLIMLWKVLHLHRANVILATSFTLRGHNIHIDLL